VLLLRFLAQALQLVSGRLQITKQVLHGPGPIINGLAKPGQAPLKSIVSPFGFFYRADEQCPLARGRALPAGLWAGAGKPILAA
jgi:hypothetical protein